MTQTIARNRTRLMLLVTHPIQYYVPLYRQFFRNGELDTLVAYRSRMGVDPYLDTGFGREVKWDIPLLEGYQYEFLSTKKISRGIEPGFLRSILKNQPDVLLIHGYDSPAHIAYIFLAKLLGTKVLLRADTRINSSNIHSAWYKKLLKKWIFRISDGLISIGTLNRAYYLSLGARPEKIFFAPFCVDNALFASAQSLRTEARNNLGISDAAIVIMCSCKLGPRKRVADAINAVTPLARENRQVVLLIVGSGECHDELVAQAGDLYQSNIVFAGFKNQSDMPAMYGLSDIFIFPSEEDSWGLSLNEAMAAGLPCVVADGVGAAPDLIIEGENGYCHPSGDVASLQAALSELIEHPELRHAMGQRSREIIADWTIERCVAAMSAAATAVSR